MRIAQVNLQRDWGGAERHVSLLSQSLRNAGDDVVVCCNPHGGLRADAHTRGIECRFVNAVNQMDLVAGLRLKVQLSNFRPEIIHVHTPRDYLCGFLASRLLPGATLTLTRHMMLPVKPMMRRIYGRSAAVFCLSPGMVRFLDAQGVPRKLLRQVRSGIDTSEFDTHAAREQRERTRAEWHIRDQEVAVGAVGRLVKGKGHDTLLEALAHLREGQQGHHQTAIKLILVGDGPERGRLEQRARMLGLAGAVHFDGFRSDIPTALAALDVFVLASEGELLPLSVMEAMAAGLPVLATSVGGLSELVQSDITGILVPPHDTHRLKAAVRCLADDPALRRRLGIAASYRAHKDFTLAAMAEDTLNVYRELVYRARQVGERERKS